jgi:DNA-binding NarL/FixJ family response regulator
MPIKLLIAGNYHHANSEIIAAATQIPEIRIAAIMETTENTLDHFSDYKPNIALIDAFMTDITGFEISRILREQHTNAKIVIVSETFNNVFLQIAKALQLEGYVSKDVGNEQLREMFNTLLVTGQYFQTEATQ